MADIELGIIGGSGLYQMKALEILEKRTVDTPFGPPSSEVVIGRLAGCKLAFLPRHGPGHVIPPSEINFRGNIFAMKKIGVRRLLSVSAVGSMKEQIRPGEFAVPHQFIDRTTRRVSTFFTTGMVGHVGFADPVCPALSGLLAETARKAGNTVHEGGTYICIEGPQFSSRAESNVYRQWGVDLIGMTNVTEAKLSREAGLCYATLALVTDYDCWREEEEAVTVEAIIAIMHDNVERAQGMVQALLPGLGGLSACACAALAANAVITDPAAIPTPLKEELSILFGGHQ
ncbi:MAG: S-methyl-5'-thioadenosine phosphorylase [Nitrospinaceae bacterium]|nr:MAG: S-methyl-5'-thioadenosine phosphorylase [Nitrospinaceae bacterium]